MYLLHYILKKGACSEQYWKCTYYMLYLSICGEVYANYVEYKLSS